MARLRILVLQFRPATASRPLPRFDPQLATLLSLMKERGHTLTLVGVSKYELAPIKSALARALPQLIYADLSPVCVDLARRTLQVIQETEQLPIVVGGVYPTIDPAASLSLPGVHAAAIGEGDATLVTYLERMKDPAIGQVVRGVWLRDERGLARPEMPMLVEDLDSLPLPERELFETAAQLKRTGEVEIGVGRGCPQACAYCINPGVAAIYKGRGAWVRRRSPEHVLDEIEQLRAAYGADTRTVRFLDHSFALDPAWLDALLAEYRARCPLPFRCHIRPNSTTDGLAGRLAAAGCRAVDIEVISGSDFIRNEIFAMNLSGAQIETAFEALRAADIRTRAIVYLGSPYESEASLDETHALLARLKPGLVDVRPFYPFPGTEAADLARSSGWIHTRGEEQFHGDAAGIDMPACRPAVIVAAVRRFRSDFPTDVGEPWWRRLSQASLQMFGSVFRRQDS